MHLRAGLLHLSFVAYSTSRGSTASIAASGVRASANLILPDTASAGAHCVSGETWPDWRGEIDHEKCWEALATLRARVPRDHAYVFWSGAASDRPPPSIPRPWRLPDHADAGEHSNGSCRGAVVIDKIVQR